MVTKLTILCIVLLVCIVWVSCILFAHADQYKTLGIRHADVPLTCIFEPDPLYTNDVNGVVQVAENSVNLWQEKLYEYSPDGNWKLPIAVIPIEDHKYKAASDFSVCSVLITYDFVNVDSRSLGFTYIDFSKSWHKYTHITVFLNDLQVTHNFDFKEGDSEGFYTNSSIAIEPFSLTAVQNITVHEMGHALGLGHYKITDYPIYGKDTPWLDASIMYYSINPKIDEIAEPKYVDIMMLEKIYGEDGFGGSTSPPIKAGYYTAGDIDICIHKCNIFRQ